MLFTTDKIEPHGYFQTYLELAAKIGPSGRILEVGVLDGESLKMWQALFPTGDVTGVDNNEDAVWPEGTHRVICNQNDPRLAKMLEGSFDLIVDDASHYGLATQQTFLNLFPLVKPGGYYVIEDWQISLTSSILWGSCPGPGMLKCVEALLLFLDSRESVIEEVTYRYGLAIVKRSAKWKTGIPVGDVEDQVSTPKEGSAGSGSEAAEVADGSQ